MLMREEVLFQPPPATIQVRSLGAGKNGVKMNNIKKNISINKNNNNIIKNNMAATSLNKGGECVKYVCSRVTLYYNSRIELKWRRALHHCQKCKYGDAGAASVCGAIHYGMCTPVTAKLYHSPPTPGGDVTDGKSVNNGSSRVISSGKPLSPTSHPPSSHSTVYTKQTISNVPVATAKDKEITPKDVREKEHEKENTHINITNNNFAQTIDNESPSIKESSRTKRKDNSNRTKSVIQNANIPKFHFPYGRPTTKPDCEEVLLRVSAEFSKFEGGKVFQHQMAVLAKTVGLPLYWKCLLFIASGGIKQGYITYQMFSPMWKRIHEQCYDPASQFVMLLSKQGTNYLEDSDLVLLIQDVVDTHPGLTFLLEAPEFHSRYVNTVVARILYCVNRSWTGRITIPELRKSNFLRVLLLLEEEDDINQIMDFFSYEHFYVIYCKFWELDRDHDLFIDRTDLARHNEHAISTRMIDRIYSGAVTRSKLSQDGKMSYPDFVWFLLSEEDKKTSNKCRVLVPLYGLGW